MSPKDAIMALFGLLTTIALALAGFSLKWAFDANAEIKVMNTQIVQLKAINNDIRDNNQDRQLADVYTQLDKLWKYTKYLHWGEEQIRFKVGMPPAEKPYLD